MILLKCGSIPAQTAKPAEPVAPQVHRQPAAPVARPLRSAVRTLFSLLWLAVKIAIILLLSNREAGLFVYQNF
jgi:hypothetical protein